MSAIAPSLTEVVKQCVVSRTGRRVHELSVEIGEGHGSPFILRGKTGSYHVKQLATHAVQEVFPNARLENAIVVE